MTSARADIRMRQFLLVLTLFIFASTVLELVLQEHTGEFLQWIPFILCAIGLIAVIIFLRCPQRTTLRLLRGAMIIVMAGGVLGILEHLLENYEFEREIRPASALIDVLIETLKGAAPLLAPGILIFAALLALAATYYYPVLAPLDAGEST